MLIKFSASNILSFNEKIEFNMTAGRSTSLRSHIVKEKSGNTPRILKGGIFYGANAAGKSNFVKAIRFAKKLVTEGTMADSIIPIKYFKLDKSKYGKPSKFEFEFMHNNTIYAYGFFLDSRLVLEEWLFEVGKTTEKKLFHRKTSMQGKVKVDFKVKFKKKADKQFLGFVAQGTRPNQLFLTEAQTRNVQYFSAPYDWFKNSLEILSPHSRITGLAPSFKIDKDFYEQFQKTLIALDTGIDSLVTKEIDLEKDIVEIPKELKEKISKKLKKEHTIAIVRGPNRRQYTVMRGKNNELIALKLLAAHKIKNSNEIIYFELNEESDGTNRLIDLIPALHNLTKGEKVFIVDEIDRSLHPNLTYKLFDFFFKSSKGIKSQFIATTHDSNLLTLGLFRRDEIWFIEKNKFGESKIYSLEEFKPRYDKNIKKGYMLGRFGAIPIIHDFDN